MRAVVSRSYWALALGYVQKPHECKNWQKEEEKPDRSFLRMQTCTGKKVRIGSGVFAQRNSLLLLLLLLPFSPVFPPGGNIDWRWMPSRYKSEEGEKYAENTDGTGVLKKGAASNKRIKKEKCKDIRCRRIILANSFWMQYFGWEVLSLHLILINSRTQPIGSSFPDRGWLSERSTII